tara:strand:- start:533 stop:1291 length:759 start_codon:yes stop_codon:yes gene_type:complete
MECPTCYCDLNINNIVNSQCGHTFCKDCFWKWVNDHNKNDCPMCRSDIINNNRFKQSKNKMIRMSALASKYNVKFHEALKSYNNLLDQIALLKDSNNSPYKSYQYWKEALINKLIEKHISSKKNFEECLKQLKQQNFKIKKKKKLFVYDENDPINDIHKLFEIKYPQNNEYVDIVDMMDFLQSELTQEESDGYTDSDTDSDLSSMPSLEAAGYDDDPYTDYYERGISIQSMGGTGGTFLGMNVVTGEEEWGM